MEGKTDTLDPSGENQESQISHASVSEVISWSNESSNQENTTSGMIPAFTNGGFDCNKSLDQHDDCKMEEEGGTLIADHLFRPDGSLDCEKKSGGVSTMDEDEESSLDYMVCDSTSKLIPKGFLRSNCTDEVVLFVNAGAETTVELDSNINIVADKYFEGGDVFQTNESITEGGDVPFIYHSARLGDFQYLFNNLPEGNYFIDLHFVEMINTFGPKGMRVFNVYLQEEKILADFDIFSVVGANKPLQLVDSRVSVKPGETIVIRFEGITGSPLVSGICIRRAPKLPDDVTQDFLKCQNCAADIEIPSVQKKVMRKKSVEKYEKRIQELTSQRQRKTDECYQAWMSLTAATKQLEKVHMELDKRLIHSSSLDQKMEKQSEQLRDISSRYEHDKKVWVAAVKELSHRITVLKQDHSQLSLQAHQCADSVPDLNNMVSAVQALVAQCEDLKVKYNQEQIKRRKLHNQLEDTKGNIRVFCRCRPPSKQETLTGWSTVVDFDAASNGELGVLNSGSTKKTFRFDRVFTPNDNQVDVFAHASPLVTSVLDGYNVCIFAYGQTGTGKTFTMEGIEGNRGVNYRTLEELFKIAKERVDSFTYDISVSVLEVYNEQIRDLLATPSSTSKKLEIKQASEGFHNVPGLVEAKVENIKEVWNVLQAGSSARVVGSNNVNEHSSRSHCMLSIMVKAKNLITNECTKSKLWLVDLAGSERVAKTDAQGERLKEAQNINRSLSALGDVISALANKSSHIPYRNSKLTHLLQDSLGGDSKTLMFVQISPSEHDLSETLSSLNFATRVRGVELGPAKKQIDTSELQKIKIMLDKAKQESRLKDESLRKLEESLQNVEGKIKGKDQVYKNQVEKIKELETQIELKTGSYSQLEKQISNLSEKLKAKEEFNNGLQQKVKELENKLTEREELGTITYQQKVRDLEDKLKVQVKESKSYTMTLQEKIEELERKLKEQEQNSDSTTLLLKIKVLEEKLKDQERRLSIATITDSCSSMKTTTRDEGKHVGVVSRDKFVISHEAEQHVLRGSNLMNRQTAASLNRSKRNDSLGSNCGGEVRRKRVSRNSEVENVVDPQPPPRVRGGSSRVVKPAPVVAQRPVVHHGRPSSNPSQGVKDRDSKKRVWA
ncbi:kinesin-like protein KIN-14R [Lactuca sativa]|uniref:kinesin-like protein KIN-14R n=1 Tax=Lactuca sativa TaxID=4236 RepID=UPI000CD9B727|nr:kinesin-like protein KIN-14R [Lactuca sativa]